MRVKLRPKVFQVLTYLIEQRDRVVSKDELLEQLWPNQFIGDGSLNACMMAVRKAVGDSRQTQRYIQTLHSRGYRFIAEVRTPEEVVEGVALLNDDRWSCAACTHQNPAGASFCNACGAPLGLRGASTASPSPSPQSPSQETSASPLASGAERRQLTVISCDVVEATALSGQLDPEAFRDVVRAYHQLYADVSQSFDGYIAQYLGDGLLAYFGRPRAYDDDVQRAIRASLHILDGVKTLNIRLEREVGIRLAIRMGIHTGLVVIGEVGGRQEQLALGQTPNVAARLQSLAAPGTVVVSAATYHLTEGYFRCECLGVRDIKGVAQPMAVYRVLQGSGAQSRLDVAAVRGLTPLVGRESEMALLRERWAAVQEGVGQVVLLSGEAGIGKSRLVQVLKDHVADTPHLTLECRCLLYARNSAWHPILALLPRLLQWSRDDSVATKQVKLERFLRDFQLPHDQAAPLLATLLSLPVSDASFGRLHLAPQEQRQQLLDVLLAILLALAQAQPLLLIVEDVHWMDPSTLDLLQLVIDQGPTAAICTLLTCRPTFQPTWGMRAHLWPLVLSRLPRDQAALMVAQLTAGQHLPPEVVAQLVDKTDGVPLFIEEMTKAVLESGGLQEQPGGDAWPSPVLTIPASLQDSLMSRLDHLDTAKPIAQLGATIGREFSYRLLCAVADVDEGQLHHALEQLIAAELVYQRGVLPQATYLFKHALIQDAAYQSLLLQTRQQYHQRIVEALEAQSLGEVPMPPDLLAYHATAAGLTVPAVDYWRRAGDYAYQRGAYREAADHFRQGLTRLQTLPDGVERTQREFDLLLGLGPCLLVVHGAGHPGSRTRSHAHLHLVSTRRGHPATLLRPPRGVLFLLGPSAVTTGLRA